MSRASRVAWTRVAVLAGAVGLLEAACRTGLVNRLSVIPPSEMVGSMVTLIVSGEAVDDIARTLATVAAAVTVAVLLGGLLGVILHGSPRARHVVEPVLAAWYAVPIFVFYPLLVALLGLNAAPLVAIGVLFATPAMLIATLGALDRVPRVLWRVARLHRLSRLQTARLIVLPASLPALLGGVKLVLAYAFIGVIAGEFILAGSGLGYAIAYAYESFENKTMYGLMLFVLLTAIGLNLLLSAWEARAVAAAGAGVTRPGAQHTARLDALWLLSGALLLWQAAFWFAGDVAITPPVRTFGYAAGLLGEASFWGHAWATCRAFAGAFAITAVGGVALGLVLGLHRFSGDVAEPLLAGFYTVPKVTLYPVVLLLFGLGVQAKVAFGAIHGLVPVTLFTLGAIRAVPEVRLRTARALRLSGWATMRHVLLPAVLPDVIRGLRIGFATTFLGVLIGEMFASQRGLGFLIINGMSVHNVAMTTSVSVLVIVFALAANGGLLALDRRLHRGSAR